MDEKIRQNNEILLEKLGLFLNFKADFITAKDVKRLMDECNISEKEAFSFLLAAALGLDIADDKKDMEFYLRYFPEMIKPANLKTYTQDAYFKNVKIIPEKKGDWELKLEKVKPYEAFVNGDMYEKADGTLIPQIGYFSGEYFFPAALQNGREWMTLLPNEIETTREHISSSKGKVLTFGLGLGYYTYHAASKDDVTSVTVVERDENAVKVFNDRILPYFSHKEKIKIIIDDAFDYAEKHYADGFYYVFADIWHDVEDGIGLYEKFKKLESLAPKNTVFGYWLEKTLKCYMK